MKNNMESKYSCHCHCHYFVHYACGNCLEVCFHSNQPPNMFNNIGAEECERKQVS